MPKIECGNWIIIYEDVGFVHVTHHPKVTSLLIKYQKYIVKYLVKLHSRKLQPSSLIEYYDLEDTLKMYTNRMIGKTNRHWFYIDENKEVSEILFETKSTIFNF
jgi:hypothetical protein